MNYIPLALAHMDKPLYEAAKDHLLNMTYADYFYIISYPTYDGYEIEHDPIYNVFFAPTTTTEDEPQKFDGIIVIGAIVGIMIVAVVAVFFRRKS